MTRTDSKPFTTSRVREPTTEADYDAPTATVDYDATVIHSAALDEYAGLSVYCTVTPS